VVEATTSESLLVWLNVWWPCDLVLCLFDLKAVRASLH